MKVIFIVLFGFFYLITMFPASAEEPVNGDVAVRFQKALTAYEEHAATTSGKNLIPFTKELYDAGTEYYQKDDVNLGILAQNHATAINSRHSPSESIPLLKQAISIYKKAEIIPKDRLVQSLIELGKTYYKGGKDKNKSRPVFNEVIELVENDGDELQIARAKLTIGTIYLSYGLLNKRAALKAKKYIEYSFSVYKETQHKNLIIAAFWFGKANLALRRTNNAAKYFELTIEKAEKSEADQYYAMASHAFLVDTYSRLGEEEKATEHCQAIGKNQIWDDAIEARPLYLVQPKYPKSAARKGKEGYATLDFTIDSNGFVKDATILQSFGGDYFGEAAAKVLKEWRFAPKFENGKPVEAKSRYTMEFKLAK